MWLITLILSGCMTKYSDTNHRNWNNNYTASWWYVVPAASPSSGVHSNSSGDCITTSSHQLPAMSGVQIQDLNASIECISPIEIVTNPVHCNVSCTFYSKITSNGDVNSHFAHTITVRGNCYMYSTYQLCESLYSGDARYLYHPCLIDKALPHQTNRGSRAFIKKINNINKVSHLPHDCCISACFIIIIIINFVQWKPTKIMGTVKQGLV